MLKKFFCVLLLILSSALASQAQQSPVTVIRAGKLIDVDAGCALSNHTIVIRNGKIESIGANLAIPAGATLIDLSKMTALPGLMDCHTHLADGAHDGNGDPMSQLRRTASQVVLESVPNARVTLESGFTTVRDVGVYRALNDVALRDAINKGYIVGPRMFVAGAYITITGAAAPLNHFSPTLHLPLHFPYCDTKSPLEVRPKIRPTAPPRAG